MFSILMMACVVAIWIYTHAPKPQEKQTYNKVPKIPYTPLIVKKQAIPVFTRGRVAASDVRQITNEVSGLVRGVSEHLKVGAIVKQGDVLIQLDEHVYILDIAQKQADLDRVKLELVKVKAKSVVAQKGLKQHASEYARHIPQVRHAKSQVLAAEAALSYAKKNLEKTRIRAPINGKIVALTVTEGEYITPSSSIAKIYGTEKVDIRLPLNDRQIDMLGLGRISEHTAHTVTLTNYQNKQDYWVGSIVRTEGERDMNQLLYVVAQVSSRVGSNLHQKPLLPGSFVEAKIEGKPISNLHIIPRNTEQESNVVWVIDDKNTLRRKSVDVLYRGKHDAYIKSGLLKGDRVVSGAFHLMAEGLTVQPYMLEPSVLAHAF